MRWLRITATWNRKTWASGGPRSPLASSNKRDNPEPIHAVSISSSPPPQIAVWHASRLAESRNGHSVALRIDSDWLARYCREAAIRIHSSQDCMQLMLCARISALFSNCQANALRDLHATWLVEANLGTQDHLEFLTAPPMATNLGFAELHAIFVEPGRNQPGGDRGRHRKHSFFKSHS